MYTLKQNETGCGLIVASSGCCCCHICSPLLLLWHRDQTANYIHDNNNKHNKNADNDNKLSCQVEEVKN